MPGKTVSVGSGRFVGFDGAVLQQAVDEVAEAGGGTVELPAGRFEMADALHLRSNVTVTGQGPETVLCTVPSVSSPICDWLGYGHYEVTVQDPGLFRPGMGVTVTDDRTGGFFTTTGTILRIEGNALVIDRPFAADYHPTRNARAASVHSLIEANGVRNVAVRDLVLDGSREALRMNGCRGGGVFLIMTHGATLRGVEIANYNGDAVSFQQCTDVLIQGCAIHGNAGGGIHPGSGSVRYLILDNEVHGNGGDGIFYCLRTTHSLCQGNCIRDNARHGVSIGERDTDHIVRANEIRSNGGSGVCFREVRHRGGDRIVLEANAFRGNCTASEGAEVAIAPRIRSVICRGNSFEEARGKAVAVGEGAEDIHLPDNVIDARPLSAGQVADASGLADFAEPAEPLDVGPSAAGPSSAWHLGIELPRRPPNFKL